LTTLQPYWKGRRFQVYLRQALEVLLENNDVELGILVSEAMGPVGDAVTLTGGNQEIARSLESALETNGRDEKAQEKVSEFQTPEQLLEEWTLEGLLWETAPLF
jgi:hypothetical protein